MSGSVEWKLKQALQKTPTPGSGQAGKFADLVTLIGKEIDATNKRLDQLEEDRRST